MQQRLGIAAIFAPLLRTGIWTSKPQMGKLPSVLFNGLLAASSLALVALNAGWSGKVSVSQMKPSSEN